MAAKSTEATWRLSSPSFRPPPLPPPVFTSGLALGSTCGAGPLRGRGARGAASATATATALMTTMMWFAVLSCFAGVVLDSDDFDFVVIIGVAVEFCGGAGAGLL